MRRTGKQLRPILVLLSAKCCHGVTEKSVNTAVVLEMLHTASLVHDDVVDGSLLRRGQPSLNAHLSNKAAVLTGDWLLAKAIEEAVAIRNSKILNIVSGIGQSLARGELLQLHADGSMWIDEKRYFDIIANKTAALFAACTLSGAHSSGATAKQSRALETYGRHLGIAFQLKDDLLDYSEQEIGKPTMADIADGKVTLPLIVALSRAPKAEGEEIRRLAEGLPQAPHESEQALQTIYSFVMRYDGLRYVAKKMEEHKQKATIALDVFHQSPAKSALLQLLNYCIVREY